MARRFTYIIKVEFDRRRQECSYIDIKSKYPGCQGNSDKFHFTQKYLSITATRQKKYKDGQILTSIDNALNTQLLKGLLFYCSVAYDLPRIHKISIDLYSRGTHIHSYQECKDFVQPLHSNNHKKFYFSPKEIEIVFDTTLKASAIRIALSYWLKAIDTNSSYQKFDYLWRSFGRLYLYNAGEKSETKSQQKIRELLIEKAAYFPNSLTLAKNISMCDVEIFRWRKLILHEYDKKKKMPYLKGFIERYTDGRIMRVLNSNIYVREEYLKNFEKNGDRNDLWDPPTGVRGWLLNHFNSVNDIEITTILCIKYAYFLRNQYFHGEILENTFRVKKSDEDKEREIINRLLECLIFELITNNSILRN